MPRRANSFARALSDAEKRLEKALAELAQAREKVFELEREIPRLQGIVSVLSRPTDKVVYRDSKTGAETPPKALTPEELAKWYLDRDLSSVGSVPPAKPVEPSAPVDEDALLPDDFEESKKQ